MSYNDYHSQGPAGDGYGYDDYGMPAYHEQGSSRHQKPARPPRPSQQQQFYPQQQQQSDPRMRFPRPQAFPRAQPMQPSQNVYDGSDYGDEDNDQWPLSSQHAPAPRQQPLPPAQRQHPAGARSGPPPRPQRPDYVPPGLEPQRQTTRSASQPYQKQPTQQRQQPRSASADHPSRSQQPASQQFHHGTGQWTGDGYSYSTPPSSSHGQPIAQQASYSKNVPPRPPLGPPPSARRGPSSYYSQQLSPVHPIVEEAERASLTREISREGEGGWGSQSGASMTSSNAIPIGIPRFYLDGRESGVSMTPSSMYSEYPMGMDNSPPRREEQLRPFKTRMQSQDPNEVYDHMTSQQQKAAERQEARGMNDYFPPADKQTDQAERGESPSEANIPVRQASLGKRSKPTLTTVKSGDRIRSRDSASSDALTGLPSQQKRAAGKQVATEDLSRRPERDTRAGADRATAGPTKENVSPTVPAPAMLNKGIVSSNASFLDSSSDSAVSARQSVDSPKPSIRLVQSKEQLSTPKPTHQARGRSPLTRPENEEDDFDALSKEMLEDPEKDGIVRQDSDTLKSPTSGLSGQRVGKRRPPRLDVDAIRDEEARGSLSSLSDLIRRATKLASNLDRGRTASRLGMEAWLGNGSGNNNSSGEMEKYRRSAASLSDMLAAFPPPGVPTPTGHENRSLANWSSRRNSAPLPSDSDAGSRTRSRKQRRCCGIPMWLFITLLLLLLVLVAAAAVIPVVLVVLPNQKSNSSPASQSQTTGTQAATLSKCATKLTCENGGQAFPMSKSDQATCMCLCVNSFTGPTCSSQSTAGCSSIDVPGIQENATIGNAIPRLLSLADTSYNLQLDSATLLGLFNEADLNCAAENALVSFDGKTQKHRRVAVPQISTTLSTLPAAATSNGIVYDSSPSPSKSVADQSPSSTSSSSASSATVDVDFARAAVLYILQSSSSLQDAESAQKALQETLDGGQGGVVDVGNWTVDLDGKKVTKA